MPEPVVQIYPDLDALSSAAARAFVQVSRTAQSQARNAWIALSGGSTPRRLFQTLAGPPFREQVAWDRVHLIQVDERPVPPDDPDSNYRLLRETLLDCVPLPPANVHRIRAELGAAEAAQLYETQLRYLLTVESGGFPRLDLVFLGLGDDGHTASLFPHSPGLLETKCWVIANPVEKLGLERITLTYPLLNGSDRVVFLVSGPAKRAALGEVLQGRRTLEDLPARGIRPVKGELIWMVDSAAMG